MVHIFEIREVGMVHLFEMLEMDTVHNSEITHFRDTQKAQRKVLLMLKSATNGPKDVIIKVHC